MSSQAYFGQIKDNAPETMHKLAILKIDIQYQLQTHLIYNLVKYYNMFKRS
jgi:hypothetical protein